MLVSENGDGRMVHIINKHQTIYKIEVLPFFYITVFYIALFIEDMCFSQEKVKPLVLALKALVLLCMIIHAIYRKWKRNEFYRMTVALGIGLILLLCSGDFCWLLILLMGFTTSEMSRDRLLKISIICIMVLVAITIFLYMLGVLPDLISHRTDFSDFDRHSFGFLHSNILPLCIFYLLAYYISLKGIHADGILVLILVFTGAVVYELCNSRNALVGILLLLVVFWFFRRIRKECFISKITKFMSRWSVLLFSIISILPAYFRSKEYMMKLWYVYDRIFTNRSRSGAAAINAYGIKFLNIMNSQDYFNTIVSIEGYQRKGVILDNGYIYILIRYGIVVWLILMLINMSIIDGEKDGIIFPATLIIIACVNMTDNDFLSYGFLPYMIMGVRNLWKWKKRSYWQIKQGNS